QADQHHSRGWRRAAVVRPRLTRLRRRREAAVKTSRLGQHRRLPTRRLLRARADELPRAPRLELRRQDDDHVAGRADRAVYARARRLEPRRVRLQEARLDERRLPARAATRRLRGRAPDLSARAWIPLGRRPRTPLRAAGAGEDRAIRAISGVRRLPVPGG